MSDTDWIVEGAKVVLRTTYTGTESVVVSTIERLTATQVVLANGERFNRPRLRKSTSTYGPSTVLLAYDSREAQQAINLMRRRNALHKVQKCAAAVGKARDDEGLMTALADLMDAADHARAVISHNA